ncbi:hypothetical protein PQ478_09135 [Alkalihalophilus pseudofirmus]|uniref:hypothetical protein n=1 Tax=Alkalihalophilus pseudofirmus TaxID=79885 RepID=UPI00259AFDC0|nr:hypothetical protein [Alkalihalophilus pseudofirmus]WEG18633.1 hypothetical protein PQ478_09135 [Alkalihalophilus pseudofirmus]
MICPDCKEHVLKSEATQIGRRYFHPECAEKRSKQEKNSDTEKQELKELKDYIYFDLYEKKVNMPFIMKQVSEFKNEYGYRYKGMELTLRYFYGTLGNSMQEGHGIGIIPFMYEETKKHIRTVMNVKSSLKDFEVKEERVIEINTPKKSDNKRIRRIDMDSL